MVNLIRSLQRQTKKTSKTSIKFRLKAKQSPIVSTWPEFLINTKIFVQTSVADLKSRNMMIVHPQDNVPTNLLKFVGPKSRIQIYKC